MNKYKVEFSSLEWDTPLEGVRHKIEESFGRKLRLVEYSRTMPPHWCEKGHIGYIQEGRLEVEFDGVTYIFEKGDGICIPNGIEHKHRARALSDVVRVFFVEDV